MKIISWNVNGLRAIWKKGALQQLIETYNPDIIGIQETKCTPDQVTDDVKMHNGYNSYFESATNRKGYSGVAIYSKTVPIKIDRTLGHKELLDNEGRFIMVEYENFYLLNCYWPNGGKSPEHFQYKLEYYDKFLKLAKRLEKKKPVIFLGDINATVSDMDLARPKENAGKLGCTPEEREHLRKYTSFFIDTWRTAYPDVQEYTWWDMKTRSREKNVGWRIDYVFVSKSLQGKIKSIKILGDVMGSDHCPVILEVEV